MDNKQPKVINKSGTTKLTDEAAAAKEARAEREFKGRRRDPNVVCGQRRPVILQRPEDAGVVVRCFVGTGDDGNCWIVQELVK